MKIVNQEKAKTSQFYSAEMRSKTFLPFSERLREATHVPKMESSLANQR